MTGLWKSAAIKMGFVTPLGIFAKQKGQIFVQKIFEGLAMS